MARALTGVKLTTKGRYAVTALLDVALHAEQGPVALADVSTRQGISLAYLEQLFAKLRRGGLVQSIRGPGGGFVLAHAAADIDLASIVESVDESIEATRCGGAGNCQDGETCLTHSLWTDLSARIRDYLASINLADLIARREVRQIARRQGGARVSDAPTLNVDAATDGGRDTDRIDTRMI